VSSSARPANWLVFASILVLPSSVMTLLDVRHGLELGILITAATLWISELIPSGATGLLVPVMMTVLGVAPAELAFRPFSNHILFLLLGSLLLVRALTEAGVDRYLAGRVIRYAGAGSAEGLATGLMGLAWLTGMWMSNTACAMLLLPMVLGLIATQSDRLPEERRAGFQIRLLLTIALVPTFGGMLTPFGSLPNAVALSFLERSGLEEGPTLVHWFITVLPLSCLMMIILYGILRYRYPFSGIVLQIDSNESFGPKLSADGARVLAITVLAVLLWVLPGLVATTAPSLKPYTERLPLGVASLCAALLLFIVPRASSPRESFQGLLSPGALTLIDFNLLALFAGGLALGQMLDASGIAGVIGSSLISFGGGVPGGEKLALILATVFLSEVGSNTAASSIMVPIALASAPAGTSPVVLVMAVALASGLGAMLPVSTPPNAVVYGTGKVPIGHMIRTGILVDVAGVCLVSAWAVLLT
jgi:solute carrier family 13 (sodium-dependent dicarboxylate transporter), member 2/3/5